jgi:hypothetical protein
MIDCSNITISSTLCNFDWFLDACRCASPYCVNAAVTLKNELALHLLWPKVGQSGYYISTYRMGICSSRLSLCYIWINLCVYLYWYHIVWVISWIRSSIHGTRNAMFSMISEMNIWMVSFIEWRHMTVGLVLFASYEFWYASICSLVQCSMCQFSYHQIIAASQVPCCVCVDHCFVGYLV